ncbi:phosphonate ABC transporter ATP-binding protein [Campylobacter suis]|uniref:Phosphate-import ATP-binding protein PhnC n=1 Tax=Campylobacter suis TaxID=2790657 RepID=A0ABM8Q921_9BACT|nr:ATP-binding cassette domain-containing protein [Campylobacter suis]CAD7289325.1 Phosphate-import ATP-binding protein PhnC [Campylobacter suis]
MSLVGNIKVFDGDFKVLKYDMDKIKKSELISLRKKIGIIFQGYYLVERLSVLDNVISGMLKDMPIIRAVIKYYSRKELQKAKELMEFVDIQKLSLKRCDELSGGQRQRVAIARALAAEPKIILADEPVSALDPKSAVKVMKILKKANQKKDVTIIANLHHLEYAKEYCDRIIALNDGKIVYDGSVKGLSDEIIEKVYANAKDELVTNQSLEEEIKIQI